MNEVKMRPCPTWHPIKGVVVAALQLAAYVAVSACGGTPDPQHLVLVTLDTLRADRLGAYGHDVPTSPHFDQLACRGVRFEQAIAQSIATPPSHASILTGMNPPKHGLRRLSGQALAPENVTLAEWLEQRGFQTAAFVSALPLRRDLGLHQGFRHYDDEFERQRSARETNARVRLWLEGRSDSRTFLWVHYFDPHWPYLPPAREQQRFARRRVTRRDLHPSVNTRGAPRSAPDAETTALMGALYDGEIAATDAALGELVEMLEEAGILGEALLAVVADHGECLGERGYYFGHWDVYPETARVPMILVHPSGRAAGARALRRGSGGGLQGGEQRRRAGLRAGEEGADGTLPRGPGPAGRGRVDAAPAPRGPGLAFALGVLDPGARGPGLEA